MTIDDKIRDEKPQYDYPTDYLTKSFEKQIKTIKDQGRKVIEVLKVLKPNNQQLTSKEQFRMIN